MLDIEAPGAEKFIQSVTTAYAAAPQYPSFDPDLLSPSQENGFVPRRQQALTRYICTNGRSEIHDSQAFLGEWLTCQVLSERLVRYGYSVDLARPLLEYGRPGRHGIDIVIADQVNGTPDPLVGINVKLQRISDKKGMENHHFDPAILGPSINVSLGNWQVDTREADQMDIRSWMHELVLPHALHRRKIPHMHALRDYVIGNIERTLGIYLWKWEEYLQGEYVLNENQQCIIPANPAAYEVFDRKLRTSAQLFAELFKHIDNVSS